MFERFINSKIESRLNEKRRFMQVVIGPRQVGKTTAICQILEKIPTANLYASADLPAPPDTGWIARQWDLARLKLKETGKVILVLDEVQKISHWSVEVKRLWDEDTLARREILVVILGSSSLLIQQGLEESLAGRFELIPFLHWSFSEARQAFGWTLDEYIFFGGYPGTAALAGDQPRWQEYLRQSLIETALSKDILLLNRIEKPALLRQLFVLACQYGGQILSYQKILGQLQDAGNTTTLAHYQHLLESAFLIKGLQKFSGSKIRQRNSSPKWVPMNTGLISALDGRSFEVVRGDPEIWGRRVEAAVCAHAVNQALVEGMQIEYWRQGHHEVDLVLTKNQAVLPLEVKSGARRAARSGLDLFQKNYHSLTGQIVGGSAAVSLEEFFSRPLAAFFV